MSIDPRALRTALGQFATGIVIVTARGDSGDVGMTMNSFNAVSLSPPLVLFSIERRALGLAAYETAEGYAINLLSSAQRDLSASFARAGGDKWSGIAFSRGLGGAPIFSDNLATFQCKPFARHEGGDHVIFVVEVVAAEHKVFRDPLLYFRGRYAGIGAPGPEAGEEPMGWPLGMHY